LDALDIGLVIDSESDSVTTAGDPLIYNNIPTLVLLPLYVKTALCQIPLLYVAVVSFLITWVVFETTAIPIFPISPARPDEVFNPNCHPVYGGLNRVLETKDFTPLAVDKVLNHTDTEKELDPSPPAP
jgi:hypothetical protein